MDWTDAIIAALKAHDVRFVSYVPDAIIWRVLSKMQDDPFFRMVPCTREDDAIGVAAGAYLGGSRGAAFMQSSGFGNCINALASLTLPARIPFLPVVSLRGELWEFNTAQVAGGRAVGPIMQALGMYYETLNDPAPEAVQFTTEGAIYTTFNTRIPVGLLIGPRLSGGKRVE